jgi:hypothetical protein
MKTTITQFSTSYRSIGICTRGVCYIHNIAQLAVLSIDYYQHALEDMVHNLY